MADKPEEAVFRGLSLFIADMKAFDVWESLSLKNKFGGVHESESCLSSESEVKPCDDSDSESYGYEMQTFRSKRRKMKESSD